MNKIEQVKQLYRKYQNTRKLLFLNSLLSLSLLIFVGVQYIPTEETRIPFKELSKVEDIEEDFTIVETLTIPTKLIKEI